MNYEPNTKSTEREIVMKKRIFAIFESILFPRLVFFPISASSRNSTLFLKRQSFFLSVSEFFKVGVKNIKNAHNIDLLSLRNHLEFINSELDGSTSLPNQRNVRYYAFRLSFSYYFYLVRTWSDLVTTIRLCRSFLAFIRIYFCKLL